jgi:GDP-L-fucose synthase
MKNPSCNVGTGQDITIRDLAQKIAETVSFAGKIAFDASKPDGTPRKLLNIEKIFRLGWKAAIGLPEGLTAAYRDFWESGAGSFEIS